MIDRIMRRILGEKLEGRKVSIFFIQGRRVFHKRLILRNDNTVQYKGKTYTINPDDFFIFRDRLAFFVDMDKMTSIPPIFTNEVKNIDIKERLAERVLRVWLRTTGIFRRYEEREKWAFIIVALALIVVAVMFWIYSSNLSHIVDTIKEIEKSREVLPPPINKTGG